MFKFKALICFFILIMFSHVKAATISVGSGSSLDFGGATISSSGLTLDNSGQVDFGSSQILLSNLSNQANALMLAANSVLTVTGNWFNGGSFDAMTSSVQFIDGVSPVSQITGQTTFNEMIATTSNGKVLSFAAGIEQAVVNNLELTGIDGNLLMIVSDNPGNQALLSLYRDATQSVDYVDVSDNHGVWQVIAPGTPSSYNSIQGPNVRGWFGTPLQFPVPTIGYIGQILLIVLMLIMFTFFNNFRNEKGAV
jgi:hypothetical protein